MVLQYLPDLVAVDTQAAQEPQQLGPMDPLSKGVDFSDSLALSLSISDVTSQQRTLLAQQESVI